MKDLRTQDDAKFTEHVSAQSMNKGRAQVSSEFDFRLTEYSGGINPRTILRRILRVVATYLIMAAFGAIAVLGIELRYIELQFEVLILTVVFVTLLIWAFIWLLIKIGQSLGL